LIFDGNVKAPLPLAYLCSILLTSSSPRVNKNAANPALAAAGNPHILPQ
jgi:hypothetical protein